MLPPLGKGILLKISTIFVCTECGRQLLKWAGKCPNCGNWNTVVEKQAPGRKGNFLVSSEDRSGHVMLLSEMPPQTNPRLKTNIGELDRVLGGGTGKTERYPRRRRSWDWEEYFAHASAGLRSPKRESGALRIR